MNLDDEVIGDALQRLRSLGIRLAVDDFGTGYSSLAYLQRLPLDILKADRCFVAALGSDSINAPILEAIVKLAHKLGLEIIAEGVEEAWPPPFPGTGLRKRTAISMSSAAITTTP